MIGYIQGKVIYSDNTEVTILLDTGIGYQIRSGHLYKMNSQVNLFIYHHITENGQTLWGFNSIEDKKMFELLLTVNKIGPTKAFPLINNLGVSDLINAIIFEKSGILSKVPGIGTKMAEQIILSLKDKVKKIDFGVSTQDLSISRANDQADIFPENPKNNFGDSKIIKEAVLALESLGYKDKDVLPLITQYLGQSDLTSEQIIKKVLKEI